MSCLLFTGFELVVINLRNVRYGGYTSSYFVFYMFLFLATDELFGGCNFTCKLPRHLSSLVLPS